ncbi:MAG: MFS transporter [Thermoprotei archaeon]
MRKGIEYYVLAIGSITAFGENMLYSLLSLYLRQDLGLSNIELGAFFLVLSVSSIVLRIPVGILADIFNRALLVLAGLALLLLGRVLLVVGDTVIVYASAILLGLGVSMYYIPHAALTADVSRTERSGAMLVIFSKLNLLTLIMGALGLTVGGYVSRYLGRVSMIVSSAVVIAIALVITARLAYIMQVESRGLSSVKNLLKELANSVRDRFLVIYLTAFFGSGVFHASFVFLQVLLGLGYELSDDIIGVLLTIFSIISAVTGYYAGKIFSSKRRRELIRIQALTWLGIGVLSLLAFLSTPLPLLIVTLSLLYALLGVIYPVGNAVLYSYIAPHLRATVGNIMGMVWRTGYSVGSATAPYLVDSMGLRAFLLQACIAALATYYLVYKSRIKYLERKSRS